MSAGNILVSLLLVCLLLGVKSPQVIHLPCLYLSQVVGHQISSTIVASTILDLEMVKPDGLVGSIQKCVDKIQAWGVFPVKIPIRSTYPIRGSRNCPIVRSALVHEKWCFSKPPTGKNETHEIHRKINKCSTNLQQNSPNKHVSTSTSIQKNTDFKVKSGEIS